MTDVTEKATLFNDFFANQCKEIATSSELPPFKYVTEHHLGNVVFEYENIISIIRYFDPNKAHGWDEISICMIKISDEALVPALKIIFDNIISTDIYPDSWKKANVPVHQKEKKSIIKYYIPISLLPIFGKILEKCIYNSIYEYFEQNHFFTPCQSGFRKGDSCISQLLAISHEIFLGFDATPSLETCSIFLDISKAFDRVWHKGLLFKLQSYGITGLLLTLIKNFLSDRLQRVEMAKHLHGNMY